MAGVDYGAVLGDFGGAVSDLFGAVGSEDAASAYAKEAQIASQNATLTQVSTAIQEQQQQRTLAMTEGTETAATAGAGFNNSGSALDLMRSSVQQGALAKGLIVNQGAITAAGYTEQAQAAEGQSAAAKAEAAGKAGGGIFGALTGIAGLFGL